MRRVRAEDPAFVDYGALFRVFSATSRMAAHSRRTTFSA